MLDPRDGRVWRSRRPRPTTRRRSPTRDRGPGIRGAARRSQPAAPAAFDARPVRAGLRVQGRGRSPASARARSRRTRPIQNSHGRRRMGCSWRAGIRATRHHPQTGLTRLDLTGATEVSCNIWYALTGLETGGEQLVAFADHLGRRSTIPFDLPTAPSQVTDGSGSDPAGSSTTSNSPTPRTARARRSSPRSRWRSSRQRSRTVATS